MSWSSNIVIEPMRAKPGNISYKVTRLKKFLRISTKIFDWVWSNGWDSQAENSTPVRDEV